MPQAIGNTILGGFNGDLFIELYYTKLYAFALIHHKAPIDKHTAAQIINVIINFLFISSPQNFIIKLYINCKNNNHHIVWSIIKNRTF